MNIDILTLGASSDNARFIIIEKNSIRRGEWSFCLK